MIVEIQQATTEQKPVVKWLLELYLEEMCQMKGGRVPSKEVFLDDEYLNLFWTIPGWHAFLIHFHKQVAGFLLVNTDGYLRPGSGVKAIPEIFVLRRYRRQGIGKSAAFQIFDRFPGKWEVLESDFNALGQTFWRRVISEYTGGVYSEGILDSQVWQGPVQSFDSKEIIRPSVQAEETPGEEEK